MKMVEFTRDMAPHRKGEGRVVPDDVAARLVAEGVAIERPSVFDDVLDEPAPKRARYLTRRTAPGGAR